MSLNNIKLSSGQCLHPLYITSDPIKFFTYLMIHLRHLIIIYPMVVNWMNLTVIDAHLMKVDLHLSLLYWIPSALTSIWLSQIFITISESELLHDCFVM